MIRRARAEDAEEIRSLLERAYAGRDPPLKDTLDDVRAYLRQDEVYVDEEDGRIVGTVSLRPIANVRCLAVDPEARREGVGARLLERAVERAREDGYTFAELGTAAAHPWLSGFYARHGFEERGTLRVEGDPTEWRVMRRKLKD